MAQAGAFADPGAEPRGRAAQGREQAGFLLAAERHHEGRGVAQVGTDVDGGHGDRGATQIGVPHIAAFEQLGEDMTQLLADPELALAGGAIFLIG